MIIISFYMNKNNRNKGSQ